MPAQALTFEQRGLPTFWLVATSLGWALVPLTHLQTAFRTYAEIARQLPVYALVGFLLGAATGLGQALVLRQNGRLAWRWWLASAVGFALALPLALVVVTLIPSFFFAARGANPWFLPLSEPAGTFFNPLPNVMALCGGVVGAAQWLALRRLLPRARPAMALLWIFGAWASLSIGLAIGEIARTVALGFGWTGVTRGLFGRAVAGAAIGLFTGTLLILLTRESQRLGQLPGSGPKSSAVTPHLFLAVLLGALLTCGCAGLPPPFGPPTESPFATPTAAHLFGPPPPPATPPPPLLPTLAHNPELANDPDLMLFMTALADHGVTPLSSDTSQNPILRPAPGLGYRLPQGHLHVHVYPTAADAHRRAPQARAELAQSIADWIGTPHLFECGRLLAMYFGDDPAELAAVDEACTARQSAPGTPTPAPTSAARRILRGVLAARQSSCACRRERDQHQWNRRP
jgi:hypothetical protein